jgi:primosomal protein N' (replication factor Y)
MAEPASKRCARTPDPALGAGPGTDGPPPRFVAVAFNLPVKHEFTYLVPAGMDAAVGCRVSAPFGKRKLTGVVVGTSDEAPEGIAGIREIARVVDKRALATERTLELARWMAKMYLCSFGEALATVLPGGRREGEAEELPLAEDTRDYALAEQQLAAVHAVTAASTGSFYLHGVTGSGKTDVYLAAARDVTAKGAGVIYLVPEISLTHQVVRVFTAAFGARLAVLHSALTPSQRLREWLRVLDGEVDVVIGARSAVFAPFARLGLVVIDEEQEGAYKSGSAPRYHARQVAMWRVAHEGGVVLMGSATPSLEAWHHMREGTISPLTMGERVSGGRMPAVDVVDMRRTAGPLSARLLEEIARTRAMGRQTILFLNRRGFAYVFHCRSCGYAATCRHCSVSLTYHRDRGRLVCHYCGFSAPPERQCPECGSLDVGFSGLGTEGIEQALAAAFPDLAVRRVDTDSVRERAALRDALEDFRRGRVHVLLGTQMVAKGLDFPGVRLVGIVNADTGAWMPDFRAAERTFDLLVQVSGRAGRSIPDGLVLIQTMRPDSPVIVLAREGKLEEFYARELDARRELGFPPFTRLIRLVLRGKRKGAAGKAADGLARPLAAALGSAGELLGPAECPIARISGSWRSHLIVRCRAFGPAHEAVARTLEAWRRPAGVHVEVDVDPLSLL